MEKRSAADAALLFTAFLLRILLVEKTGVE